jgi:dolichyl-phosphate mannosyltransferase polypeptide 3
MARAQRFATYAAILTTIYILVFLQLVPVPLVEEETVAQLIPVVSSSEEYGSNCLLSCFVRLQIPWWLLVTFGSYSLWSLGWGLFTFRDCDEAYEELMGVSTSRSKRILVLIWFYYDRKSAWPK